jgi:hypothetical protein
VLDAVEDAAEHDRLDRRWSSVSSVGVQHVHVSL